MTTSLGEGEWVALVTRIEEAMCIIPFRPRQEDVITLLSMAVNGNQHMLRVEDLEREVERLLVDNAELSDECDQWQKKLEEVWIEIAELRARLREDER